MQTKLTLRLDERLIRRAKRHARRSGKSVSQMVAEYFSLLGTAPGTPTDMLPPIVASLRGALSGSGVEEKDYYVHLEEKHQ
jgi:hypothetical protein